MTATGRGPSCSRVISWHSFISCVLLSLKHFYFCDHQRPRNASYPLLPLDPSSLVLNTNPWVHSYICTSPPESPYTLSAFFVVLGCWRGGDTEEASSEQCVSAEQVTRDRNPQVDPCILKAVTSTDMCALMEKTLPSSGASGKMLTSHLQQHQTQLSGEKHLRRDENGALLVTSCKIFVPDTVFTCGEVEEDFLSSLGFLQHQPPHDGEHPHRSRQSRGGSHPGQGHYKCSECGKAFSKKYKFTEHLRVHTGEKPYKCNDCGKFFRLRGGLSHHRRVHTGEKPFDCSKCGKVFIYKCKLVQHQRVHTGERPYECQECGKAYARKDSLVQHQKVHTGEKPHKCSECGKLFLYRNKLLVHQRIHTGEKPF